MRTQPFPRWCRLPMRSGYATGMGRASAQELFGDQVSCALYGLFPRRSQVLKFLAVMVAKPFVIIEDVEEVAHVATASLDQTLRVRQPPALPPPRQSASSISGLVL